MHFHRRTSALLSIFTVVLATACAPEDEPATLPSEALDEPLIATQAGDPVHGEYDFLLEVSGITPNQKTIIGGFKSMSGMESETEVIELNDGTSPTGGFAHWASAGASDKRDGQILFLAPGAPMREARFEGAVVEAFTTKAAGIAKLRLRLAHVELVGANL